MSIAHTERLAALGLTPQCPVAWVARDTAVRGRTAEDCFDPLIGVVSARRDRDGGQEYLAVARTPEGDAALTKMLGLDVRSAGWVAMSGALDEAEERGLCLVHEVPRADGRHFVVTKTPAAVEPRGA